MYIYIDKYTYILVSRMSPCGTYATHVTELSFKIICLIIQLDRACVLGRRRGRE